MNLAFLLLENIVKDYNYIIELTLTFLYWNEFVFWIFRKNAYGYKEKGGCKQEKFINSGNFCVGSICYS